VYVLAKENDFSTPEQFAILLSRHFCGTYGQVKRSSVNVRQTAWNRISVGGKPHDHAFIGGGSHLMTAVAESTRDVTTITGGVVDLMVLKTTRSAFKGFVTDKYRTLGDADDRILATQIAAAWAITDPAADFAAVRRRVMTAMLDVFATTMSHAVQQTMYDMGRAALAAAPEISRVDLELPNKHRIPVNLKPFGLENKNEIFVWTDEPFGNIFASIARDS
jgi:urate oxidase